MPELTFSVDKTGLYIENLRPLIESGEQFTVM